MKILHSFLILISLLNLINFTISNPNLMSRERYEILKSEASFSMISYEEYSEIFANRDLKMRIESGENTYKQEMDYLKQKKIEEVYEENTKYLKKKNFYLPSQHDCRQVYPQCFEDIIRDQLNCGGCW